MDNAMTLASVMGPAYLVLGLSMLFYAKPWEKVVNQWSKDHFALIGFMFMTLILGLVSVQFYNVWEWNVWLIVTLTGWGMILKGVAYFLLPGKLFTNMLKMANKSGLFYVGGLVVTLLGAVLSYYVWYT